MKKTISQIREEYRKVSRDDSGMLELFARSIENDERAAVQAIARSAREKAGKLALERERLERMRIYERQCREEGYSLICGIDEAGRGPLAGPVVAGAVILPEDCEILGLALFDEIREKAIAFGTGVIGPRRIDEINILQADYEAMCEAIGTLSVMPQVLLNDAVIIPQVRIEQKSIIHGDAKSVSVAAASIIAKVTRDRMMEEYDSLFPEYGFARHKGYGTADHYAAIKKYGPCPIHRRSFLRNLSEH